MFKNKWFNKIAISFIIVGFATCFVASFAVFGVPVLITLYAKITDQSTELQIEDVFVTSVIDETGEIAEQETKFQKDSDRIYAVVKLRSLLNIPVAGTLWLRWYHEDEQIAAHYIHPDPRNPIIVWIEPPENGHFREGEYRLEIFLDWPLVETVEFEVE